MSRAKAAKVSSLAVKLLFEALFDVNGALIVRARVAVFITVTLRILGHEHCFVAKRGAIEIGVTKKKLSVEDIATAEQNKQEVLTAVEGDECRQDAELFSRAVDIGHVFDSYIPR